MQRPMLLIFGIGILAAVAAGVLMHSVDPFTASIDIKALFFASMGILIVSASLLILYEIAVAWHNGMQYFFAKYFGPEMPYFKSAFRRAVLIAVLAMALIGLRRFGIFTRYFAGGAAAIIILLELFYSAHDKQVKITS